MKFELIVAVNQLKTARDYVKAVGPSQSSSVISTAHVTFVFVIINVED